MGHLDHPEPTLDSTILLLANRWAGAGALYPAFSLLAAGRPLEVEDVARVSNVAVDTVTRALEAARCERDEQGRLIDLYGMTLTPTRQRLEIDNKILFSCCALWAHVIPKLVDTVVEVESVDPICRELVHLRISPDGVESSNPHGAAATLAVATQQEIDASVHEAFCGRVCHFVSRETALEFAAARQRCRVVELPVLQAAAEQLYEAIRSAVTA